MQFRTQNESVGPAGYRNVSGILLAFVLLSFLAHAGTLLFLAEPILPVAEQRFGTTIISTILVSADQAPVPAPQHLAPKPQIKEPVVETALTKHNITTNTQASLKTHITNQTEPTFTRPRQTSLAPHKPITGATPITATRLVTSTNASLTQRREQQRNYLLGELQNRLSKYLTYPQRARRRGWQGEVLVAFYINKQGQLNDVRLARSSGYSLLDHSALSAIAKLDQISLPDELGRQQAMELQLPVRYQLREG